MQLPWQTVAPALGCQIGFAASLSAESSHGWPAHIAPQRQRRRQGAAGRTHYIRAHSAEDSIAAQKDDHANRGCDLARRSLLATAAFAAASVAAPGPSTASKLPEALDRAWEGLGGGPADLVFPGEFLGVWDVESVLTGVELPLGPEFVPDMRVVQRAQQEDLNAVVRYQVAFLKNQRSEVVPDRRFNTASLLETYTGTAAADLQRRIDWNPDDPNLLQLTLPGGLQVSTRVARRSAERPAPDRLITSEYFQQLIDTPQAAQPKVKASQCFTKYHWRTAAAAAADRGGSGVQVVATQVVSDYLTSFDDPAAMMEAGGKPVVVYTYRMTFKRAASSSAVAFSDGAAPDAAVGSLPLAAASQAAG